MSQEHYSSAYPLDTHFPQRRFIWGWEGGEISVCERSGVYYLIVDERTLAEFLLASDPANTDILNRLVTVYEFDTENERRDQLNDLVLQAIGYELVQATEEERTYIAHDLDQRVILPRAIEITQEVARGIRRERRSRTS